MAGINVNMPDELRKFVDEQVALKGFATPTEYVRQLIRDERKRAQEQHAAHAQIERLLIEGLESGPGEPMTAEVWDAMEARALARYRAESKDAS